MMVKLTRKHLLKQLFVEKLRRNDISKSVNVAARIVVDELPDYIGECTVIYLPEMGHLIAIKEWQDDCDPNVLQQMGYQFVVLIQLIMSWIISYTQFKLNTFSCLLQ